MNNENELVKFDATLRSFTICIHHRTLLMRLNRKGGMCGTCSTHRGNVCMKTIFYFEPPKEEMVWKYMFRNV